MKKIQCPHCNKTSDQFDDTEHDLLDADFNDDYSVAYVEFYCPVGGKFQVVANLSVERVEIRK